MRRPKDRRYSIEREFCGYVGPRFVARFCDEWIGQSETKEGAEALVDAFEARRWA